MEISLERLRRFLFMSFSPVVLASLFALMAGFTVFFVGGGGGGGAGEEKMSIAISLPGISVSNSSSISGILEQFSNL